MVIRLNAIKALIGAIIFKGVFKKERIPQTSFITTMLIYSRQTVSRMKDLNNTRIIYMKIFLKIQMLLKKLRIVQCLQLHMATTFKPIKG